MTSINNNVQVDNLVPLTFSLLLAVVVALLYKPARNNIGVTREKPKPISWLATASSLTLGTSLFLFQLFMW